MKKIFQGFLFGGLLGATYSLLTAPEEGKKTRQKLKNTFDSAINLQDASYKIKDASHKITNEMTITAKKISLDTSSDIKDFKTNSLPHIQNIRGSIQNIQNILKKS